MAIKILIIVFLIIILYSLGSALVFLVKDHGEGDLFLFLWGAYQLGWIEPNSGPVRVPVTEQAAEPD